MRSAPKTLLLFGFAPLLASCAITFQVKQVDHELGRRETGRSQETVFTDRRFRLEETINGDVLELELTGTATRTRVDRTEFEVRYRKQKTIRYRDGDWRLRFHALFWGDDYPAGSWRDYALGNLALLFPTLAISGIVMVFDLATLPIRLIDFDREVYTKKDRDEARSSEADWAPAAGAVADCDGRRFPFRGGRARIPVGRMLAPPGQWRGTMLCKVKVGRDELFRHAIHLDRLALGSPRIRRYIFERQHLILRDLARTIRSSRTSASRSNSIARELQALEKIIDLTLYIQPRGNRRLLQIKETGEDLLYVEADAVKTLLEKMDRLLKEQGY